MNNGKIPPMLPAHTASCLVFHWPRGFSSNYRLYIKRGVANIFKKNIFLLHKESIFPAVNTYLTIECN